MIEIQYIIAFSAAVVNVVKKSVRAEAVPFCTILIAVLLNVINALLFGGDLLLAGKEAFIAGGVSVAMFAGGDAVRKIPSTPFQEKRPQEAKTENKDK